MAEPKTPTQDPVAEAPVAPPAVTLPPWLEQVWSDRRIRYGAAALLALALAVAGYLLWRSAQQDREQEASVALSRVLPYIEAEQYDQALDGDPKKTVRGEPVQGLRTIADTYGGTTAGKTAAFYAGQIFLSRKQYDDAERYFEQASSSDAVLVRIGAQAGLAACYEHRSKFEEAARLYEQVLSDAERAGVKDKFMLEAALCYEKAGKADHAIRLLKALLAEFEFSEYAPDAKAGLVRLGTVVEY
ncbi:MAG: tetratricopeptide repeat protein [Chlorobiota bacterium]|nr:MAG: tetratricopeptide repeat protein [Chlorobiota bacterium]